MTTILVADDHELVRRGVRLLVQTMPSWEVCAEASTGDEAVVAAEAHRPDVVVLDLQMPGLPAMEAARAICTRVPRAKVLVYTIHDAEDLVLQALAAGAQGYVLKTDPGRQLLAGIEALVNHGRFLTPSIPDAFLERMRRGAGRKDGSPALTFREREVVRLLARGQPNRKVANLLGISIKTVESHRANVMRKLELQSLVDLVRYAVRNRLIEA